MREKINRGITNALTNTERQMRFKDKMRTIGFSQVTVWVPDRDKKTHKNYVNKLKEKYCRETGIAL